MKVVSSFGKKIKEIRLKKNMSINSVSKKSGVSQSYLSQIENGSRDTPQPDTIKKIANGLDVDYFILMRAAGYMATSHELAENDNNGEFVDICFSVKKSRNQVGEAGQTKLVEYTEEELKSNFFNLYHLVTQTDSDVLYKDRVLNKSELEKVKTMLRVLLEE